MRQHKDLIKGLVDLLERASDVYYNSGNVLELTGPDKDLIEDILGYTASLMEDSLFDALVVELQQLDANNKFLASTGYQVPDDNKVELPRPMLGLTEVKYGTGAANKWLKDERLYVVSDKLDSVSILLDYSGKEIKAYTRGDGEFGQDISHLVPYLKLPTKCAYMYPRGELIMPKQVFKEKWSKEALGEAGFKNARNLVSGLVNRKDYHPAIKDCHVCLYSVLDNIDSSVSISKSLEEVLDELESQGFNIVNFNCRPGYRLSEEELARSYEQRKQASIYDLDGLVLVRNSTLVARSVEDNQERGRKFKMNLADDSAEVEVLGIEYEESRMRYLKPVLLIQPTKLSGAVVSRVTAHNQQFIDKNRIGVGAKIKVCRSGEVIPYILGVVKGVAESKVFKPDGDWAMQGTDAVRCGDDENDLVKAKKLTHFFRTLGAKEMSDKTFIKVVEAGYDDPVSVMQLSLGEWLDVEGFGKGKAEIALRECGIDRMRNITPAQLADALGIFGRGFGETRFNLLHKQCQDLLEKKELVADKNKAIAFAKSVDGFSDITAKQFAEGFPEFVAFVEKHAKLITWKKTEEKVTTGAWVGQRITFTGFRDGKIQEKIIAGGGEVIDFGAKTTLLVYGGKKSSKVDKAIEKGIPVITQAEFLRKFN